MKYIANIITNNKIEISSFFNITNDFNTIDKTIPTLIIGWNKVKDLFPSQNILENKISDNIKWTFSKREKRYQYEKDIVEFINDVCSYMEQKVNYRFYNYILSTQERRNNFVNYVNNGNCSIYYNSKFAYIYNFNDSVTIGISLLDLLYINVNINEFIKSLNKNGNNIICNDLNFIDKNSFSLIKDNIKAAAYLNYLKNSNIYIEKQD